MLMETSNSQSEKLRFDFALKHNLTEASLNDFVSAPIVMLHLNIIKFKKTFTQFIGKVGSNLLAKTMKIGGGK